MFDLQEINNFLFDKGTVSDLFTGGLANVHCTADNAGLEKNMAPQPDIIQNSHPTKDFNFLKSSGDAKSGPLIWFKSVDVLSFEINIPLLRTVQPVYAIHHDRLAGPVRADDGMDLPFSNPETDTVQSRHPAKIHVDIIEF